MEAAQFTPEEVVRDAAVREAAVREAVHDGLREVGSPISRRLAEVKGLHNNSIRRLERIEATLDSERNARIDDLALLVELLTEGWRSMNGRLARIEQLLIANLEPRVQRQAGELYNLPGVAVPSVEQPGLELPRAAEAS
jgi:hypothetical protein